MLEALRDLIAHKGHADAAVLTAVINSAPQDPELLAALHHILLANRFWLLSILGQPFALEEESRPSGSAHELAERYRITHEAELQWLASATAADLTRVLENPLMPGGSASVLAAWMQVCLHSHGHRAQCVKLLRERGAATPPLDFIVWLPTRPTPAWPRRG